MRIGGATGSSRASYQVRAAIVFVLFQLWQSLAVAQLLGPEFQVNSYTHSHQRYPAVAANDLGDFVVAWQSFGQDGSSYGVFGRRFDAVGIPAAPDIQVNTYTTGLQPFPSVAALADGGFVIAWSSPQEDGWNWGVFAQRYDAAGAPAGGEFHVNTYTTDGQYLAGVSSLGDGGFVVVWQSSTQDGSDSGLFAQRFNAAGSPLGGEFQVNTETAGSQDTASVAADALGNFVIVWESRQKGGSVSRIVGRRFDAAGEPLAEEFQVGSYTTDWQRTPAITVDASGNFVVAWESRIQSPDSRADIHARRFDSTGAAQGGDFLVNSYTTSDQISPAIAMDPQGGFLVTWASFEQDGSDLGVFAQRYSHAGSRVGSELQVSRYAGASQGNPAVTAGGSGEFVVVWDSRYQDGSSWGVFGQRLAALSFSDDFESGAACAWTAALGGGCP